jgi:hypothetical protein
VLLVLPPLLHAFAPRAGSAAALAIPESVV